MLLSSASAQQLHVNARIITELENIPKNEEFLIGVELNINQGWHLYAENPGDSGFKTEVNLSFDKKVETLKEFTAPTPYKFDTEGIINYGYKNKVIYTSTAKYIDNSTDLTFTAKAHIKYLICKDICIPEELNIEKTFTLGTKKTPTAEVTLFEENAKRLPQTSNNIKTSSTLQNDTYIITFSGLEKGINSANFIPSTEGVINDGAKQIWSEKEDTYTLELKRDIFTKKPTAELAGILNISDALFLNVQTQAKIITGSVVNAKKVETKIIEKPLIATETKIFTMASEAKTFTIEKFKNLFQKLKTDRTLQLALLFAFLGGLILNLMPCVLPVLSLKALSLIHHAQSKFSWWYGIVYTLGILSTFGLLAFTIITLKNSGSDFGWGFQLQTPIFVASLALLMLLVALQLSSVFNFGASFGRLQNLVSGHGTIATFLSGMLITVVATPCTAPFMATAIAFALAQPNEIIYATFGALGFGLAFPYLMMTFSKRVLGLLPKPGAWEITFQHFLAFPMFATALWLTWIYAQQTSLTEAYSLLLALLVVSFATWIFGRMNVLSNARPKRWLGLFIFLAGIVYFFYTLHAFDTWYKSKNTSIEWKTWSTEAVREGLNNDRPVFVNFTADWCITCKVNEKIVIESDQIKSFIEQKGILMLKADWTSKDSKISAELRKFDRYGVPLYLMYSPDKKEEPHMLKQILTYSEFKKSVK